MDNLPSPSSFKGGLIGCETTVQDDFTFGFESDPYQYTPLTDLFMSFQSPQTLGSDPVEDLLGDLFPGLHENYYSQAPLSGNLETAATYYLIGYCWTW